MKGLIESKACSLKWRFVYSLYEYSFFQAKQRRKKQMGLNRNIITPTDGQELDQIVEGAPTEEKVQKGGTHLSCRL